MAAPPFPMPPRPPFPPIDPIDPCRGYLRQLTYVNESMTLVNALLLDRTGSAFIQKRASLRRDYMMEVLRAFAADWTGFIPPFVPLICRHMYSSLRTRQRAAYYMLNMLDGNFDDYVGGKRVVDGFLTNRPHNRDFRMVRWMQELGY